jgi:hypothetical protein
VILRDHLEIAPISEIPAGANRDRFWFRTWTTYATWLPGDDRGFVSNTISPDGRGFRQDVVRTNPAAKHRGLSIHASESLRGAPVWVTVREAASVLEQLQETADHRGWTLIKVPVMANHVHLLVGVPGDPDTEGRLRDFKSDGSRRLDREFGGPSGGT